MDLNAEEPLDLSKTRLQPQKLSISYARSEWESGKETLRGELEALEPLDLRKSKSRSAKDAIAEDSGRRGESRPSKRRRRSIPQSHPSTPVVGGTLPPPQPKPTSLTSQVPSRLKNHKLWRPWDGDQADASSTQQDEQVLRRRQLLDEDSSEQVVDENSRTSQLQSTSIPAPVPEQSKKHKLWRPWDVYEADADAPPQDEQVIQRRRLQDEDSSEQVVEGETKDASVSSMSTPLQSPSPLDLAREGDMGLTSSSSLLHQIPGFDPRPYFELEDRGSLSFRGVVVEKSWKVKFLKPIPGTPHDQIRRTLAVLQFALHSVVATVDPNVSAQLFLSHRNIYTETRASKRQRAGDLDLNEALDRLEEVVQSSKAAGDDDDDMDQSVKLDEVDWTLVIFKPRKIGGLKSRRHATAEEYISQRGTSLLDPSSKGYRLSKRLANSCMLNCVALGKARCEDASLKKAQPLLQLIRKDLEAHVIELASKAGLPVQGPHQLQALSRIQEALGEDYQISVYTTAAPPVALFGQNKAKHHINLMIRSSDEGSVKMEEEPKTAHCILISNMNGLFGKPFCELCKSTFSRGCKHRCSSSSCSLCSMASCQNSELKVWREHCRCDVCNRSWASQHCYEAHLKEHCGKVRRCLVCWELFPTSKEPDHPAVCGKPFCSICKQRHLPFQHCFVPTGGHDDSESDKEDPWASSDEEGEVFVPPQVADRPPQSSDEEEEDCQESKKKKKKKKKMSRIYADCETAENPETGDHHAILVVAMKVTSSGEPETFHFCGETAMADFAKDCLRPDSPFKDAFIVFHNLNGFDGHLFYRECLALEVEPELVLKGQKIISMRLKGSPNISFRDSLLFLPGVPLSKFPSMFGLKCGLKGQYPYKLQGTKHVNFVTFPDYEGEDGSRFPALEFFGIEGLRPAAMKKLKIWHSEQSLNFQKNPLLRYNATEELLGYCEQDVRILMEGFEIYRSRWLIQFPELDIIKHMTFPQFANALYRRRFMKKKSICPLPPDGFERKNNVGSVEAFGWMQLIRKEFREAGNPITRIRDARRGFEIRLGGVKVDGWGVDSNEMQHVFQYQGCHWHGCPVCGTKPRTAEQEAAYERTLAESARLRALSTNPQSPYGLFTFHEIWSHDFYKLTRQGEAKTYWGRFRKSWPKEPLRLRQGFFGGRTNAIKHQVVVKPGWRLAYVDFTSLYPAINASTNNEIWPIGYPQIYIGQDIEEEPGVPALAEAFGFWKVRVHPPHQLMHPVLGQSVNGRLVFSLCATCSLDTNPSQGPCFHSRAQRALYGVFFTEELKKAVEKGYELDRPEEIWEWPKDQRTTRLWRSYIRSLYAQKVLSSAAPSEPAAMEKHLKEQLESIKLRLRPEDFKRDECQRALSKFALNNVWGYHGKTGKPNRHLITADEAKINQLTNDDSIEVTAIRVVHGGAFVRVDYRGKEEETHATGSIACAMMTTAYARLRLYHVIDAFQEETCYFDTDSAFLLLPPGKKGPETSSRLGDLKDEIAEGYPAGSYISYFCSLGPKTYVYQVCGAEGQVIHTEIKTKGLTLNHRALELVTRESMSKLVEKKLSEVRVPQFRISRDMLKKRLYSQNLFKRLAFSSTKRFFKPEPNEEMDTLPFGFGASGGDKAQLDSLIRKLL